MDGPEASEAKFVLRDLLVSLHNSLDAVDLKDGRTDENENDEYLKESMGISDETLQELHGVCDVANLQCEGEPVSTSSTLTKQEHFKNFPENEVSLQVVAQRKEELAKEEKLHRGMREQHISIYKYLDEPVLHSLMSVKRNSPNCNVQTPDLIINVTIHSPFDLSGKNGYKNICPHREYQVLGQQLLTDLRDAIECRCDKVPVGEFSEFPHKPPEVTSADMYKSGFFFFNNVFYDDLRDPSAIRYSDEIVNWAKKPGRGLPTYEQKDMESVHFIDLTIKLGEPYVYQHQGSCEHILTFTDVKLLHPQDCHDIGQYPMCVMKNIISKTISCCVCYNNASWLSVGFHLSPDHESYYCNTCFHSFHYGKDGKKISEFNAYPILK